MQENANEKKILDIDVEVEFSDRMTEIMHIRSYKGSIGGLTVLMRMIDNIISELLSMTSNDDDAGVSDDGQ